MSLRRPTIEAFQKYTDSWRMDHPDFLDVAKTTFAKGVIGDGGDGTDSFDVTSSVPIQVRSMVRVEGDEWGVSDFIPIFYHPKPHYWNDFSSTGWQVAPAKRPTAAYVVKHVKHWDHFSSYYGRSFSARATDLHEEGYFERAWMSFRCGDEVAVMLREKVPIAVLGHADGVPRVGEDLIKFHWRNLDIAPGVPDKRVNTYRACVGELYKEGDLPIYGEDGKLLKLIQPARHQRSFNTYPRCSYKEWFIAVGPIYYIIQIGSLFSDYTRLNVRAALYSEDWFNGLPEPIAYENTIYNKLLQLQDFNSDGYWWGPDYNFSAPQDCFTDRLYLTALPLYSQTGSYTLDNAFTVSHTKDGVPE